MDRQLPEKLKHRLAEPLPGDAANARFAAKPARLHHYNHAPEGARRAAVMILLYPHDDAWHLPLTLRPPHMEDHAGQVCFPGGAIDPGETSREAAVRELHEELGAEDQRIELLGTLSPVYVRASNFHVKPWVAVTDNRPDFRPNPAEVEQLLEIPLLHLLDRDNQDTHERHREDGTPVVAPHFDWQSYQVWGATCLMLGELVMIAEELLDHKP